MGPRSPLRPGPPAGAVAARPGRGWSRDAAVEAGGGAAMPEGAAGPMEPRSPLRPGPPASAVAARPGRGWSRDGAVEAGAGAAMP